MTGRATDLSIAAAQFPIGRPRSFEAWADGMEAWTREAAERGADLLVFPEYAGLEVASIAGEDAERDLAVQIDTVAALQPRVDAHHVALAKRYRVHILAASLPTRPPGQSRRAVNRARLFAPGGDVGIQDKRIMTPWEREIWGIEGDQTARVFDTALGRIGVAICYDGEFPLIVRAMVVAGAEIILVPSATDTPAGAARVRVAARARALENQVTVVTSPTVGDAPWSPALDRNHGCAGIYVPSDSGLPESGIIAEGAADQPGWVYGNVDLAAVAAVRTQGGVRGHADWNRQPGASEAEDAAPVEIIPLA